jgi:hypothetical protein
MIIGITASFSDANSFRVKRLHQIYINPENFETERKQKMKVIMKRVQTIAMNAKNSISDKNCEITGGSRQ